MITNHNEFDWDMYDDGYIGSTKLHPNKKIQGVDSKTKCFSRETYAQKLFNTYTGHSKTVVKKDLIKGDCVLITDIIDITDNLMNIEISGGLVVSIDLNREKRFLQMFGFLDLDSFVNKMSNDLYIKQLVDQHLLAYVIEASPNIKVSLWQGYLMGIRDEFMGQISNPSKAYTAKVKEANKGGFFVEVQGIDAFMPGSLAAPNKINNFQSYVGKEIIVMVEDFLKDMNSFIVSHKKYISYILPQKLAEIDMMNKYTGHVTGASKYGIFVEFAEFFTGLLHISKMNDDTLALFNSRQFKPGDKIEFYVGEVTKDKRVILTEEDPYEKLKKVQKFIIESQDKILVAKIVAVMKFGTIVSINDITGLIPLKEFKKNKISINNYVINDNINVMFGEFKDDKLVFEIAKK